MLEKELVEIRILLSPNFVPPKESFGPTYGCLLEGDIIAKKKPRNLRSFFIQNIL
jgi:hypothetical protein